MVGEAHEGQMRGTEQTIQPLWQMAGPEPEKKWLETAIEQPFFCFPLFSVGVPWSRYARHFRDTRQVISG